MPAQLEMPSPDAQQHPDMRVGFPSFARRPPPPARRSAPLRILPRTDLGKPGGGADAPRIARGSGFETSRRSGGSRSGTRDGPRRNGPRRRADAGGTGEGGKREGGNAAAETRPQSTTVILERNGTSATAPPRLLCEARSSSDPRGPIRQPRPRHHLRLDRPAPRPRTRGRPVPT